MLRPDRHRATLADPPSSPHVTAAVRANRSLVAPAPPPAAWSRPVVAAQQADTLRNRGTARKRPTAPTVAPYRKH